jgi:alpha-D-xyloside xylohydrolase
MSHYPRIIFLFSLACLSFGWGCGGATGGDNRPGLALSGFGVFVDTQAVNITLEHDGLVLVAIERDGLQLGRVDSIDDNVNYDPWPLLAGGGLADYTPPAGLRWLDLSAIEVNNSNEKSLDLNLLFERGVRAELKIELVSAGSYRLTWTPSDEGEPIAYFRIRARIDSQEGLYGLGGFLDQLNNRGKLRAMQTELDLDTESGYNEAHIPIPLVIGTRGWGLFVESTYPAVFDAAYSEDNQVTATFGTGAASTDGLVFHLFADSVPLDITRHYFDVTGYPALPARWALGPLVWRDENDDQAQVENDLDTMRELDLATNAIWIDRPYASGVNSFDFDPAKFPDPQSMISSAHDLGFRLGLWHTPYLDENDSATASLHDEAESKGYFPPRLGLVVNGWSAPIDFSNPDAFAWWQDLIRRYTDMGIEGFKLDYAEDVVVGILGARNKWEFADGSDERTMHAVYQLLYHRVYAQTLPSTGGFLLCRAASYGDQLNGSIIWPGDLDANMANHGDTCPDGDKEYVAVGGLPASVIYGLSLGPSGFPFYGADTGGYRHSPPDKETFTRWFEQTALSSVMQIGTSTNDVAWEPTAENGFDAEMLDWYRLYTRLHLRLWPYEWSLAAKISETGRPIQRPLGLACPGLGVHPDDVYLFGPDLLVAPVVKRGERQKVVVFPPGIWLDWWNDENYQGETPQTVDAPLETLPLYQRSGSIIPMLRPSIDTLAPTNQPERVDSYATSPGILWARVAPGAASSFTLFDGTKLSQEGSSNLLFLGASSGDEFGQGFMFEVTNFRHREPSVVTDNGTKLSKSTSLDELELSPAGWYLDNNAAGRLYVKVTAGEHTIEIERI